MQEQQHDTDRPPTIDEHPALKEEHSPQSEAVRRMISPWLGGADTLVYVLVGLVFLLGALAMLGYTVYTFIAHVNEGFPQAIITLVNDLLLVMIIMEVLRTVLSYIEERGASLRPFLFIGAISATRRILAIGAETSISEQKGSFRTMSSPAASWISASTRASSSPSPSRSSCSPSATRNDATGRRKIGCFISSQRSAKTSVPTRPPAIAPASTSCTVCARSRTRAQATAPITASAGRSAAP